MEWCDVLRRIKAGEDESTEFERSLGDGSAVCDALCAFGNAAGGLLILGVDDNQRIVGVHENPDRVRERLTNFLRTGCSVPIAAHCGRHKDPNGWVHWIEIHRQLRNFEPLQTGGRYRIRRMRSSVEPSPSERQELFNNFGFKLAEEQVIRAATIDDIDVDSFHEFLCKQGIDSNEDPRPSLERDMKNSGILATSDGRLIPTLFGIMVFGRDPQGYPNTSDFLIRCTAYTGSDRASNVLSSEASRGRLEDQIRRSLGWFSRLVPREIYRGFLREGNREPLEQALREALLNAVIHREYAISGSPVLLEVFTNRIDVTSPGALPYRTTVEQVQFGSQIRSRNESMAHAMVVAGLMEQRGRGWPVMRRAMAEFNGSEPELVNEEQGKFVRVRFRTGPEFD